jgi:hypothetical protein
MIVRLVLTENEATPDRDLLARLALRHRMRAVHCSEPVTLATPCVASHRTLAGSEERMALRAQAPLDRTLGTESPALTPVAPVAGLAETRDWS